jgi:hypothetical protein
VILHYRLIFKSPLSDRKRVSSRFKRSHHSYLFSRALSFIGYFRQGGQFKKVNDSTISTNRALAPGYAFKLHNVQGICTTEAGHLIGQYHRKPFKTRSDLFVIRSCSEKARSRYFPIWGGTQSVLISRGPVCEYSSPPRSGASSAHRGCKNSSQPVWMVEIVFVLLRRRGAQKQVLKLFPLPIPIQRLGDLSQRFLGDRIRAS